MLGHVGSRWACWEGRIEAKGEVLKEEIQLTR